SFSRSSWRCTWNGGEAPPRRRCDAHCACRVVARGVLHRSDQRARSPKPFAPRSLATGIARFFVAANGGGFRGRACDGLTRAGSPELLSHTLGLSSVLMLGPEVRAQCGSAARWDLCGGRLEPTGEGPSLPRPGAAAGARHENDSATLAGT